MKSDNQQKLNTDIESRIREYVAQNLLFTENTLQYDSDASFLQEGIIDSMGVMELVGFVGKAFGIAVDPQDVTPENFDSVNKLARYIRAKKGQLAKATE